MRVYLFAMAALCAGLAPAFAQDAPPAPQTVDVAKYVDIQPGHEKAALAALRTYAAASRKQDGDLRETILQEVGRHSRFLVIEEWKDKTAYAAHVAAPATAALATTTAAIRRAPDDERANGDFLAMNGEAPPAGAVFVVTHVDVNPPNRPKTEDILKTLVAASRTEPGAVEFNVYRPTTALNHFTLFEIWKNANAFEAHGKGAAALAFRQAIAHLIGALYDERIYKPAP